MYRAVSMKKKQRAGFVSRPVVFLIAKQRVLRYPEDQVHPFGFVTRASHSPWGIGITFATNWPG